MTTTIDIEDIRGLEGTAVLFWTDERIEHVALRAAELGDGATEAICDSVLAGDMDAAILVCVVDGDERYREWIERGQNMGWRSRAS